MMVKKLIRIILPALIFKYLSLCYNIRRYYYHEKWTVYQHFKQSGCIENDLLIVSSVTYEGYHKSIYTSMEIIDSYDDSLEEIHDDS